MGRITLAVLALSTIFLLHSKEKCLVISLGNACGVAGALRDCNLRQEAYPFDWIVSPFDALYKMIATDFETFLDKNSLVINNQSAVNDTVNHFSFVHDFPTHESINTTEHEETQVGPIRTDFLNFFQPIKDKYNRRIERFKKVFQHKHRVVFIRIRDISVDQAYALSDLIKSKAPSLDFVLAVIDDENKITSAPSDHPHIKFFYGADYVQYDWKKIFHELELI